MSKKCPTCGSAVIGHPNKKFCCQRCKDKFHNWENPRGKFSHLASREAYDDIDEGPEGWDGHK